MTDATLYPSSPATAHLLGALSELTRAGLAHRTFFQRKAPGLRWRIETPDRQRVLDLIAPNLRQMKQAGELTHWHASVYEPETFAFGGEAAMHAVHDYFAADTSAWLRLPELRTRGAPTVSGSAISVAQLNELFARALDGRAEEVWDVWCRLAAFHALAPAKEARRRGRATLRDIAQLEQAALLLPVLEEIARANAALAETLAALDARGELLQGLRAVLATVALFHWNRIGLRPEYRRQVLQAMTEAWNPNVAPTPGTQFN
jgi:thiopeptide-type bacteriocin biosynthesis protein